MLIIAVTMARASDYVAIGIVGCGDLAAFFYGVVIGYLIVYLILIVCYLLGETSSQRSKFVSMSQ